MASSSARATAQNVNRPAATSSDALAALLAPVKALPEEKQEILRRVLQIYISKDASKQTDLEKRKKLTALINAYAKGEADEEDES